MADEFVTQQEYKGRKELCDERDKRSSSRLRTIEEQLSRASTSIAQSAEILNRISETQEDHEQRLRGIERSGVAAEQIEQTTQDHEKRLREIECRRGNWLDKIIGAALIAIVTIVVGILIYGKLNP